MRWTPRSSVKANDDLFGFLVERGPHVDDVGAQLRDAQELGAGKGRDVGNAALGGEGLGCCGRRGAHGPDQRKDVAPVDELAGVGDRRLGLIGVVEGFEDEAIIVHTAGSVNLPESRKQTQAHALAKQARRSRQGGGLAER